MEDNGMTGFDNISEADYMASCEEWANHKPTRPISPNLGERIANQRKEISRLHAENAALKRQAEKAVEAISDLKDSGFCKSCGQICHHRGGEITYCNDWRWRGLEATK